jgi:hypothetical protein
MARGSRGQVTRISLDLDGLLEIEIARQAGRDLATEATRACEALQLGAIFHGRRPVPNFEETGLFQVSFYGDEMGNQKFSMTVAARPQPTSRRNVAQLFNFPRLARPAAGSILLQLMHASRR